jgi:hypothetical protein
MMIKKPAEVLTPRARGQEARPPMVKADCLNPSHGGNRPSHGIGDIAHVRWYELKNCSIPTTCIGANSQGERKDVRGNLKAERRERVTWGSPTSREG